MNAKQTQFVVEYIKCKNATEAAVKAGYSKKTAQQIGSRLLLNVVIKAEIDKLTQKIINKAIVDESYFVSSLRTVLDRCMQAKPKMFYNKEIKEYEHATNEDGELLFEFDSMGANASLKTLGQYLKLFDEGNLKLTEPLKVIINYPNGK